MSDYGWHWLMWTVITLSFSENTAGWFYNQHNYCCHVSTPIYYTPLLRCNKDNIIYVCQLPLTSGGHRPLGHLVKHVVRGLAFEYEHEVLKGQYPQILTVRYRFPHGRPGSVHSGFKLSDHIVQAPPTLVATTSSLIYDVLVYSHLWCTCLLSNHSFN